MCVILSMHIGQTHVLLGISAVDGFMRWTPGHDYFHDGDFQCFQTLINFLLVLNFLPVALFQFSSKHLITFNSKM
jgi:hypothetical protein